MILQTLIQVSAFFIFLALLLKTYAKITTGWCKSHVCLIGKTAIITGSNQGIGFETALDLAKRGARIILACRNEEKAQEAALKIIRETGNTNVVVRIIDMCSFDSVKRFAKNIIATEERVDILVNNAGIGDVDSTKKSVDGHVLIMQVNYFSAFLLTNLLLDLLKKSDKGRVVNVSSILALLAYNLRPSKLGTHPGTWKEYGYSKLCNILFTQELARRLEGTGVTTYSLHPGAVNTEIFKYLPQPFGTFVNFIGTLFFKTIEEGAQTSIYCSVQKGIEKYSGEHFMDCKKVGPYWTARNLKLAQETWKKTEKIVGLASVASSE